MSMWFTWLGVLFAVLVIAGGGCQFDGDGAIAGSGDSVLHGAPSGSASTVMLYALDPSPGLGSYRDEGVIPFLIGTAVVVGPHHAMSVAHLSPAFDAVSDVEVFLADAPEFEKGTFQGEEYFLITNHDNLAGWDIACPFRNRSKRCLKAPPRSRCPKTPWLAMT
jgi:hypothetical protein